VLWLITFIRFSDFEVSMALSLTDVTALIGMLTGVTGLTVSLMNYLRDRPTLAVSLSWDMESVGGLFPDGNSVMGIINVTNVGRRTVCYSHVHLVHEPLRRRFWLFGPMLRKHLLIIKGGLGSITLKEGDPSQQVLVTQKGMEKYANNWRYVRAAVQVTAQKPVALLLP
jgi:hypothetical protein